MVSVYSMDGYVNCRVELILIVFEAASILEQTRAFTKCIVHFISICSICIHYVDARFWLSSFYDQGLCSINFTMIRISPRKAFSSEVPAYTDRSEYAGCFPGANPPMLKSEMKVLGMFSTNLMASFLISVLRALFSQF